MSALVEPWKPDIFPLDVVLDGEPIGVRMYEPDIDRKFILATWLNSERAKSKHLPDVFFGWRRCLAEYHTDTGAVLVACTFDVPGTIVGWLCANIGKKIEYAYVLPLARRRGVYRALRRTLEDA